MFSTTLMLATSAVLTLPARAGELPRYQLKVGQELTFIADSRLERRQAMSKNETVTWTVRDLGFVGALINGFSNIGDEDTAQYLDEPQVEPFWARVEQLGVPVYLHSRPRPLGEPH